MSWTVKFGFAGKSSRRFETYEDALHFTRQLLAAPYFKGRVVHLGPTESEQ